MASIDVLNTTQANVEAPVEIQLSLGNPIYRGPAGKDGHTPVKGVDYFTEADIQDIVDQIEIISTEIDLSDYALKSELPTQVSDLTNDAEYATEAYVDNAVGAIVIPAETDPTVPAWAKQPTKPTYTASEVGALPDSTVIPTVPTNVSDFVNDAGYLTTHQSLTDYATKNYVEQVVAGIETGALKRSVVVSLPSSGIDENTIYMVERTNSETNNVYDEYLYLNDNWEKIGSTEVDLTGYATESYVDDAIANIPSTTYTLPVSTTSTLGGVKIDGSTITIDSNGVISATSSGGSSYTFTNGLTESDGTVSWNLSDRIAAGSSSGNGSIREGNITQNQATGNYSHAEGGNTSAYGAYSHAEGSQTQARGPCSHAEGLYSRATGNQSHAEGIDTRAYGAYSHAEGQYCEANTASHAEGNNTIAASQYQHTEGKFNVEDRNSIFQNIAGGGTNGNNRANIFARDWSGNEYLAGNLYVGCNDYSTASAGLTTANAGGSKVATESYVDTVLSINIEYLTNSDILAIWNGENN